MKDNLKDTAKTKIGKISEAHGLKGELQILVFSGDISWLEKIDHLTLLYKNQFEDFKILKKRPHKKGFICGLESFQDRNKAELYEGAEVWIASSVFVSKEGESLYLKEILNFEIIDSSQGVLGKIQNFSSNGSQDLLVFENQKKQNVEIPFVKAFVSSIDFENKKIFMHLPEGLLEINEPE